MVQSIMICLYITTSSTLNLVLLKLGGTGAGGWTLTQVIKKSAFYKSNVCAHQLEYIVVC